MAILNVSLLAYEMLLLEHEISELQLPLLRLELELKFNELIRFEIKDEDEIDIF